MTRQQLAQSVAKKLLDAAATLPQRKAVVGFDAFVDEICDIVDKRRSAESYTPVRTIAEFGQKVLAASGQSSNYELAAKAMKLGGNGPIMANALACAGMSVTYIGNLGYPNIHPVFEEFASRAKVFSIGDPGHTDAVEFTDGKLMLGKITPMSDVNWNNLSERVGIDSIKKLSDEASLIGMVNWTMLPYMKDIWERMLIDVLPHLPRGQRFLFIDLADPEKRTLNDIQDALKQITRFQQHADIVLGLNLKESSQIIEALGLPQPADAEAAILKTAGDIRAALNISCVVIHPRKVAAAATADDSAIFLGPFVQSPKISTGAGDHFNAGFCLGRVLGMSLVESLCTGVATSGYYVRTAVSPSAQQLAEFCAELPEPQN